MTRCSWLALELVDLVIGTLPVGRPGQAAHPLDQHAAIPAAVEDRVVAARRQMTPESPQVRTRELLGSRGRDRHYAELACIERGRDAANCPTLASGIHSFERSDDRVPLESLAT
jgi:hypothetical protein